jgi:hypothetical protein
MRRREFITLLGGYYRDVPAVKVWNGPLIA